MAILLSVIAVAAAAIGAWIYRATRPDVRRPGEELPEITAKLARNLPPEAPMPRFTDVTDAAGLAGFRSFAGERTSQLPEDMGSGMAWGDYDNDGDDDLFLVAAGGDLSRAEAGLVPSQLFENLGDGTFRPAAGFPDLRIRGMGAAWGDYDGDGWLDLAVSGYRALRLFHNDRGRLVPGPALPAPEDGYWSGVSWADFDDDRDLDLYVCGYVQYVEDAGGVRRATEQYGTTVPYTLNPASFEPQSNLLLRNDGDGGFRDVAALWGVSNPEGRSLGALWHDFDADGLLDLYVANDISDNALYLNRGETFEEVGLSAWVADYRGAMGLAAGDWNQDGDDDLFITHWIAQENALYDSRLADMAAAPDRDETRPVQLTFTDQASPLGLGQIAIHSVGWGTEFADFDADGWLDLVVANGSTLETADEPKRLKPQPMMLFWSQGGTHFHDLVPLNEELAVPRVGRGLALADYDADGDLDMAVMVLYEGVKLYRNDLDGGNWLGIRLRSRGAGGAPGFAEGSTVVLRAGGQLLRRSLTRASYLSQSSRILHFGLGEAEAAEAVEVRWQGGETQSFGRLAAGAVWQLSEGDEEPRRRAGAAAARPIEGDRERLIAFWAAQRAAMDAFKFDADCERAVPLFREALSYDPTHEDSLYYLANCLASLGDPEAALAELDTMRTASPMSHRAQMQWGVLRAIHARGEEDLVAAKAALSRALEINREETGSLLALGEIALLRGDLETAEDHLSRATYTNPRAVGGFFLRGYMAWKRGDRAAADRLLETAQAARGPDWKPEGTTAEGDVEGRQHREQTPLSRFWESWDGTIDAGRVFAELDARLQGS
ncbi:MAG: FG-GAP-like repeat-containing protein [Thermoanaerobaculia bacterium]